jgi:hypothetical protein
VAESESKPAEKTTYHRDRLIAESGAFFGQPPHVVAGALEADSGSKVNFTRDQAQRAIDKYLDKPAEVDYLPEDEQEEGS